MSGLIPSCGGKEYHWRAVLNVLLVRPDGIGAEILLGEEFVLQPDVPICEKRIYENCPYWDRLDGISVQHVVDHVRCAIKGPEPLTVLHV